ncbi:MAG: hypothetical protein Q7R90_01840, partial [bacterium]|nr:hypothetical protein [bacterium]
RGVLEALAERHAQIDGVSHMLFLELAAAELELVLGLLDEIEHVVREHPADEKGAYIHPELGVYEYAWTEDEVQTFFEGHLELHKFTKSHRHILKGGKAGKRRTFSAYLQKF